MTCETITSVLIGRVRKHTSGNATSSWSSGIIKSPVAGPVEVGPLGLDGDEQADLVHHGGPDKAVLGYSLSYYELWNQNYPNAGFAPGGFGENLTISGFDEQTCCIGDRFRAGTCLLQISQPRQPCWKLSRRWNLPQLAAEVQRNGRTGWYFRVLKPGQLQAGTAIELVGRPYPELTIHWASQVMHAKPFVEANDLRLLDCPALSASWRETLLKRQQGHIRSDEPRLSGHDG